MKKKKEKQEIKTMHLAYTMKHFLILRDTNESDIYKM